MEMPTSTIYVVDVDVVELEHLIHYLESFFNVAESDGFE